MIKIRAKGFVIAIIIPVVTLLAFVQGLFIHNPNNPNLIIQKETKLNINDFKSQENNFIEKYVFTDSYSNIHKKYTISWDNGNADFILIDPHGKQISIENYEEINTDKDSDYHISWAKRSSIIEEWGGSLHITIFFKNRISIDGYWTIKAENFTNGFDSFSVYSSSMGENNVFLIIDKIGEMSGENKNEYKMNEKINFRAYITGGINAGLSNLPITGSITFRSEQYLKTGKKTAHDNITKQFTLQEFREMGEKTGSYYWTFKDFFGGPGYYDFEIVANNLEGNAITNYYNMLGYIPETEKVAPFNRAQRFSLYIDN